MDTPYQNMRSGSQKGREKGENYRYIIDQLVSFTVSGRE